MEVTAKDGKIVPKDKEQKTKVKPDALLKKKRGRKPKSKAETVVANEIAPQSELTSSNRTETVSCNDKTETTKEVIGPVEVKSDFSRVSVSIGLTKNIGNYESVKISLSADERCDPDEKGECFDRLVNELKQKIEEYIPQANAIKSFLVFEEEVQLHMMDHEALKPASTTTKNLLNNFMKGSAGLDYTKAVSFLRERGTLCEKEARQVIHQLRRGDFSFFEQKVHEHEADFGFGEKVTESLEESANDSEPQGDLGGF